MRSKIEANEYKDYILGFIFYKYLSDKQEQWLLKRDYAPEDIVEYVNEADRRSWKHHSRAWGILLPTRICFLPGFMGSDFSVDNVRTALSSFTRLISPSHKRCLMGF